MAPSKIQQPSFALALTLLAEMPKVDGRTRNVVTPRSSSGRQLPNNILRERLFGEFGVAGNTNDGGAKFYPISVATIAVAQTERFIIDRQQPRLEASIPSNCAMFWMYSGSHVQ
jgi:hypothetical protein